MGQIKNIKLHIVTDIKDSRSKMAPLKPYVRKDGKPSEKGKTGKRGRPPTAEGPKKPRAAPLTTAQKELLRAARKKWYEKRAQEIAEGKKSGRRGKLSNRELLEFLKKQEK